MTAHYRPYIFFFLFVILLSFLTRAALSEDNDDLPTSSGWMIFNKKEFAGTFRLFRKYSVISDSLPNTIIYNCAKHGSPHLSHLTFVLPKNFPIHSFDKQSWQPKLLIRMLVDNRSSISFVAEYQGGEIYVDETSEDKDDFRVLMMADDLALGFGDKNDVIKYHFTEKVDSLFEDEEFMKYFVDMGRAIHFSRKEAIDACARY